MKTLIIDNYDSFTWNLFQYIAELKGNPEVFQNNNTDIKQIQILNPSHIIISPGPGTVENPNDFGICNEVIKQFKNTTPILGVCLGHQGIIKHFGGSIQHAPEILHGKQSQIFHDSSALFQNIPSPFMAMRYHSLCGSYLNFPPDLRITAQTGPHAGTTKTIMGIQHCKYPIFGIQFHPESFATPHGKQILQNFLNIQKKTTS